MAAKKRLAKELGMPMRRLEREAEAMREQQRDLGAQIIHIETLGVDLTQKDKIAIASVAHAVDEAHAALQRSVAVVRTLLNSPVLPVHRERLEPVYDLLRSLMRNVAGYRPTTVCPACKMIPEVQTECVLCLMSGYLTKNQEGQIRPELLDAARPVVLFRGSLVPIEEVNR